MRQLLGDNAVDNSSETYEFRWVGKDAAKAEAARPTDKTLRPVVEDSVDWDTTKNLYIEGDNLEVLKLLQRSYMGKVKMIYIDPPYNTGNDFVYHDDFAMSSDEYDEASEVVDELGNKYVKNTETSGRFHSDWCNMIYPRLMVARSLLSEDGVIFISIDDNEQRNLKNIADEVFGECNFVTQIVWQKIHSIKNDARYFSENHEYALIYAKNKERYKVELLPRTAEMNDRYKNPDNDSRGAWQSGDLVASGERSNGHFIIISPKTGKSFDVPQGKHWVYSESNLKKLVEDNQIWFGEDGNSFPRKKRFLSDVQNGRTASTIWLSEEVGHNQTATREVKQLFNDNKYFDFPKPVSYIKQMLMVSTKKDDLILDFFSGSATTAHAVMQLNAEDGGNRKFILVQLPEETTADSEAYKAGYNNICEIGKERIRRAGKKIKEESPLTTQDLDTGFRVLRLDDSNFNPGVKASPSE
ncbi:MAG: site-specific DNA-methyltransferase, partial [Prevotella sp.]